MHYVAVRILYIEEGQNRLTASTWGLQKDSFKGQVQHFGKYSYFIYTAYYIIYIHSISCQVLDEMIDNTSKAALASSCRRGHLL